MNSYYTNNNNNMNGSFQRALNNQTPTDQSRVKQISENSQQSTPSPGYPVSYPECSSSYSVPQQQQSNAGYASYQSPQPTNTNAYYCPSAGQNYEMQYDYYNGRYHGPPQPQPQPPMAYPYMCYPNYPNYMGMSMSVSPYPPHYQPASGPGYPGFCPYGPTHPQENYVNYAGYSPAPAPPGYYYPAPTSTQQCVAPGPPLQCEHRSSQQLPPCTTSLTSSGTVSTKTYPYSSNEYVNHTYTQGGDTQLDPHHHHHHLSSPTSNAPGGGGNGFKLEEETSVVAVATSSGSPTLHDNNNTNSGDCDEVICVLKQQTAAAAASGSGGGIGGGGTSDHHFPGSSSKLSSGQASPSLGLDSVPGASNGGGFGAVGLERAAQLAANCSSSAVAVTGPNQLMTIMDGGVGDSSLLDTNSTKIDAGDIGIGPGEQITRGLAFPAKGITNASQLSDYSDQLGPMDIN